MPAAPTNLRETVLFFARLRAGQTAADVLAQIDWTGVSRRQIVHALLDRPPANADEARSDPGFDATAAATALFHSADFRIDLAARLMRHFPARKRIFFVHIPKSAGSDFMAAIHRKMPTVSLAFSDPEVLPPPRLAKRLADFARAVGGSDSIFMGGHTNLSWYLDSGLYRFGDRLLSVLRHPYEISVSLANYIVGRFQNCPDLTDQDTRIWAETLRMSAADIAALDPKALALALVVRPGVQAVNPICTFLGSGTAQSALANIERAPVEISCLSSYTPWLKETWGIDRDRRGNASTPYICWDDLSSVQQSQVKSACEEDIVFYDAAMKAFSREGRLSVTGEEIVAAFESGS